MQTLTLRKSPVNLKEYVLRSAIEADAVTLITEDTIIVDADSKEVVAAYIQMDNDTGEIMTALERIKYSVNRRTNGLKTTSKVFGYRPRNALKGDYCSSTILATEQPREHDIVCNYGRRLADLYSDFSEDTFKKHTETTDSKVLGQYRIPGTPFTSGIINKNNPLKYHFDSGNFKGVYSCMVVFKYKVTGGHLSMPEYGIKFRCDHNTALMFDGQSILHGVTPIKKEGEYSCRYSIVYYSLQQIWNCLPLDEEVARVRQKKYEVAKRRYTDAQRLQSIEEELTEHAAPE